MPVTYLANCDAPTAVPVGVTGAGGTGGTGATTPPTIITTTTAGIVGANLIPGQFAITLPQPVSAGSIVVAMSAGWASSPSVNTGAGWTEILAVANDPHTLDPGTRAAWKYFPSADSALQTPFTVTSGAEAAVAAWEIRGLDPTFTPNLHSTAFDSPHSGATSVSVGDASPTAGLYLIMAVSLPVSGVAPGVATHSNSDFIVDTATNAIESGGLAMHAAYTTTPAPLSETVTWPGGHPAAAILIGLSMGVETGGGSTVTSHYVETGTLTTLKLNGAVVSTHVLSLNVVGDATMTDDGSGNVTLTLANHGPYVDATAAAALAAASPLVSFQSGGAASATNVDATHQVDGYVLSDVASSATARVFTSGVISGLSGLTPGARYFLGTGGALTTTAPTAAGTWIQEVGVAADATHLVFAPKAGTLNA